MTGRRFVRFYGALLHLYPRSFRTTYGDDMTLLLRDRLAAEPALRVWARTLLDVAVSVPTQQLEVHVTRPSTTTIPVIATVVCFSGLVITAIVGTSPGLAGLGLAVAVSAGLVAALSWRNARTVGAARLATANWWKFLVGGGGVLATIAIATTITGEVSSGLWLPLMLTMLASIVTLALGVILGIAHLTRRAHPRTS